MRVFRSIGGILLGEDERKLLAKLRQERRQQPRMWGARLACALGVALVGFGTGYWLITLVLTAVVLSGKRARWLAYGCCAGVFFAAALLIAAVAAGSNPYLALLFFGMSAAMFALGLVLVLTTGVTFFGHSLAVRSLSRSHDVEGLVAMLAVPDPVTRAKAADALASLADPRAEQPLIRALADPDIDVRANAARGLGLLRSQEAVDRLLHALDDDDDVVRYMAASALGRIGDPRAIEPLRRISDEAGPTQDAARSALHSLGYG